MGHYMNNKKAAVGTEAATKLDGFEARRDIKRIADAVVSRKMTTVDQLTSECVDLAHEHYVMIVEVYKKVWERVSQSDKLHSTHPAGKTEVYHALRERATRS